MTMNLIPQFYLHCYEFPFQGSLRPLKHHRSHKREKPNHPARDAKRSGPGIRTHEPIFRTPVCSESDGSHDVDGQDDEEKMV